MQGCNAIYCIAIAHLIRSPGDASGAITAALEFACSDPKVSSLTMIAGLDICLRLGRLHGVVHHHQRDAGR